ncbi:MAG: delta-aminolevulinic acid dehydratase [Chlorogloea purpurea SAG 13.99]|nr:delta-aminolevulinic acid dehydratase [Chlorogloea purpurea SAG 13.99]
MTLINSNDFYTFALPLGAILCAGVLVWAIWVGIKMDDRR